MEPKSNPKIQDLKINPWIFKDHLKQKYKAIISSIDPTVETKPDGTKIEPFQNRALCADVSLHDLIRLPFTKEELLVSKVNTLKEDIKFDVKNVIFFTPPSIPNMKKIGTICMNNKDRKFYIIFVPRRTFACKEALQMAGVYGLIEQTFEFNFDLYPLDNDILSLEIQDAARQLYLDLDTTPLVMVAESLQRLQLVYGRIDTIMGKGYSCKIITDMLKNMENESKIKPDDTMRGEIDCCLLLDRNVDFMTPMLTQSTYSGFFDEIFSIQQNNIVKIEKKFFPFYPFKTDDNIISHKLAQDQVYREIRDLHIAPANEILDDKLKEIKVLEDEKTTSAGQRLEKERKLREMGMNEIAAHAEIRQYFEELCQKPSHYRRVRTEQGIVDEIVKAQDTMDFLETQISKKVPLAKVLRLLCLQSLIDNGIKQGVLDNIKREIIQNYGFEHIVTLTNLEKAGLLKKEGESKFKWSSVSKQLRLINADLGDLRNPRDSGFAYEGFTPILCRLIEQIFLKDGWNAIKNTLENLYGLTIFDEKKGNFFSDTENRKVILVYFIGGVTYGEIAVLRYLGKKYNKEILIATTSIISGDKFCASFYEKFNVEKPTK